MHGAEQQRPPQMPEPHSSNVPQTLVTVQVTPAEAPKLILANETSQLYLALLGPATNLPDGQSFKLSQLSTSGG